jgi:hypothetical protein
VHQGVVALVREDREAFAELLERGGELALVGVAGAQQRVHAERPAQRRAVAQRIGLRDVREGAVAPLALREQRERAVEQPLVERELGVARVEQRVQRERRREAGRRGRARRRCEARPGDVGEAAVLGDAAREPLDRGGERRRELLLPRLVSFAGARERADQRRPRPRRVVERARRERRLAARRGRLRKEAERARTPPARAAGRAASSASVQSAEIATESASNCGSRFAPYCVGLGQRRRAASS